MSDARTSTGTRIDMMSHHRNDGNTTSGDTSNSHPNNPAATNTTHKCVVALAISVTVTLLTAAAMAWFRSNGTRQRSIRPGPSGENQESRYMNKGDTKEEDALDDERLAQLPHGVEFLQCAELVRTMRHLTTDQQLLAYGLYKQIRHGNAPPPTNSSSLWQTFHISSMEQHAKWKAWDQWRNINRQDAMQQYNQLVQQWYTNGELESDEISSDDGSTGRGEYDGGVPSSNAFAPRVSCPVHSEDDDDDENDDDVNGDHLASKENTEGGEAQLHKQLLTAASKNDVTTLQRLLDPSANSSNTTESSLLGLVNRADSSGQTALHLASDRGSYECVEYLLQQHQANVHACDVDGISVLQAAVIAGHVPICRLLLHHGANPDQPDLDGDTPRSCAVDDGSAELQDLFAQY